MDIDDAAALGRRASGSLDAWQEAPCETNRWLAVEAKQRKRDTRRLRVLTSRADSGGERESRRGGEI